MRKFLRHLYKRLFYCARGRHDFGRPRYEHEGAGVDPATDSKFKVCRNCSLVRTVRARKAKGQ